MKAGTNGARGRHLARQKWEERDEERFPLNAVTTRLKASVALLASLSPVFITNVKAAAQVSSKGKD